MNRFKSNWLREFHRKRRIEQEELKKNDFTIMVKNLERMRKAPRIKPEELPF